MYGGVEFVTGSLFGFGGRKVGQCRIGEYGRSGPFVGAAHQVQHHSPSPDCADAELQVKSSDFVEWSFALATMCRSEFFPHGAYNRLRCRKGSPTETWDMAAAEISAWLRSEVASGGLRLPTEGECLAVERDRERQTATSAAAASST